MGENGLEGLATVEFGVMSPSKMFGWLAQLNVDRNFPICVKYIADGQLILPDQGPLKPADELKLDGLVSTMVVVDGAGLPRLLRRQGVIMDPEPAPFTHTPTYEAFARFLHHRKDVEHAKDGGYAHVSPSSMTMPVGIYGNSTSSLAGIPSIAHTLVPVDFLGYGNTTPLTPKDLSGGVVGTKTLASMYIAKGYTGVKIKGNEINVDVIEITTTARAYDEQGHTLGIPRVRRWTENGLTENLSFAWVPDLNPNKYVTHDPDLPIVAIHTQYQRGSEGGVSRVIPTARHIVTGIEPVPFATNSRPSRSPPYDTPGTPAQFSLPYAPTLPEERVLPGA